MREYIQNAFRKMDKDAFFKASVRKGAEEYLAQKARESVMTEEERNETLPQRKMHGGSLSYSGFCSGHFAGCVRCAGNYIRIFFSDD